MLEASKEPEASDRSTQTCALPPTVIPAKAGIQRLQAFSHERHWIPAFAGMTRKEASSNSKGKIKRLTLPP
ncbi:hypothetical protein [Lysobacter gummosus]|uniref:hypothetical protein n=1 Tax=Lysobacter gummosus TaxID=262324 RepID=UPI003636148A